MVFQWPVRTLGLGNPVCPLDRRVSFFVCHFVLVVPEYADPMLSCLLRQHIL